MTKITILHNPRCSKSRGALEILRERGIEPEIIEYLNGKLTPEQLREILRALNMRPKDVLRTKEEEFHSLNLDLENDDEVIAAILQHPKLLERPIVICGGKAVIGRPPENILTLLP